MSNVRTQWQAPHFSSIGIIFLAMFALSQLATGPFTSSTVDVRDDSFDSSRVCLLHQLQRDVISEWTDYVKQFTNERSFIRFDQMMAGKYRDKVETVGSGFSTKHVYYRIDDLIEIRVFVDIKTMEMIQPDIVSVHGNVIRPQVLGRNCWFKAPLRMDQVAWTGGVLRSVASPETVVPLYVVTPAGDLGGK